jgi:uncharacterized protein YkwD
MFAVCVAVLSLPALTLLARSGAPQARAAYLPAISNQPAPPSAPTPTPAPPATPDAGPEFVVLARINQTRAANNLPALRQEPQLMASASRHSRDMAANNFGSHTGSDGSTASQRIRAAGYNAVWSAEIIGWGFTSVDQMMTWWMNSSIHRAMILSPNAADYGSGYTRTSTGYKHYWVVNFGRRAEAASAAGFNADTDLHTCIYTMHAEFGGSSLTINSPEPCE